MSSKSMFETIMDLPLLKGIGRSHVERFATVTHLNFNKIKKGEVIVDTDTHCKDLIYILGGEAEVEFSSPDRDFRIYQRCGYGTVLGVDRLFGLFNKFGYRAKAAEDVGIMSFNKEQYFKLLNSDPIYLLNIVNYLSIKNQRIIEAVCSARRASLLEALALRLLVLTESTSKCIRIEAAIDVWQEMTNLTILEIASQLEKLQAEGLIENRDASLFVLKRNDIIEKAFPDL